MNNLEFIKENGGYKISIDGSIDESYYISEDELKSFMDYIYVFSIKELEDNLFMRFQYDVTVTHGDIYNYIKKNFLSKDEEVFFDSEIAYYDYANQVIPKIIPDDKKQQIHKKALIEGLKYFFENTRFINNEVIFTGGTSLFLKDFVNNEDYIRFSLDLDFSYYQGSVQESHLLGEVINTADFIIDFLQLNGAIVDNNSTWKLIGFEFPGYGRAEIKIDWMPNYNCEIETLLLDGVSIPKASDEDIVANKLKRLNERDIIDIVHLEKSISFDGLVFALKQKSIRDYGNETLFFNRVKSNWLKHQDIETIKNLFNYFSYE